jgi:hypothetical protein
VNERNAHIPRDHWLTDEEKTAILDFERLCPLEGYRRLASMMLDADAVATGPSSVYRVLKEAGRLGRWNRKTSLKGTGFVRPPAAHERSLRLYPAKLAKSGRNVVPSWYRNGNRRGGKRNTSHECL